MDRSEAEALLAHYTTREILIDNGPGRSAHVDVDILEDGLKIGSYRRNYPDLIQTFAPFVQDGRIYALYSPDYTTSRLMRLPECVDIGGEEPSDGGFCPAEFYVPYDPEKGLVGRWGFVAGCVWGDDSCWKIRYLDLSQAAKGIVGSDDRFGYLPMPSHLSLREAINLEFYHEMDGYQEIEFSVRRCYSMKQRTFEDEGYDDDRT